MIQGDGPREPRAEIIDDDGKALARSVAQPPVPIGQRPARAFGTAVAFAAILVVVVFVGVSNRNPARPLGTPTVATSPLASPVASLDPTFPATAARLAPEFPPTMDGLTVQTVATAVPNGPGSHGVIAVAGYLSSDRAVEGCPPAPTTDKPNPCSGTQLILIDQPGTILVPNDATFLYEFAVPSNLPSIRPEILPGTTVDNPWQGLGGIGAEISPWPVVVIGHFGDPRSLECAARPGGGNAGCDRSFVVDQLPWIGGTGFGPSIFMGSGLRPSHSAPDVTSAVADWFLPQSQPAIVSMTSTLPADSAALTGVSLEGRPKQLYWVVRVISNLPAGPASSLLVFDDRTLNLVEVSPGY